MKPLLPPTPLTRWLVASWLCLAVAPAGAQSAAPTPLPQVSSGRIERLAELPSRHVAARHVDVWLPPGYSPDKRYAVLYMHDGQNLFDGRLSFGGKAWNVHEALSRLMQAGRVPDTLVVGIWNSGATRYAEYYPQQVLAYTDEATRREYVEQASLGKSLADAYLRFIVEELKPMIDRRYATRPGPESTFVMGASMGGLISLYALTEHPQVFGGAAALSTHWVGKPTAWGLPRVRNAALPLAAMAYLMQRLPTGTRHRIYSDRGDDELDVLYDPAHRLFEEVLRDRGYGAVRAMTRVFPGTGHNEGHWAARLELPLQFLLGPR